jgi:hypothetical protein
MNPPQSIQAMQAQRKELKEQLLNLGPVLRGSVVEVARPCTYPRCRKCREGTRHPTVYHSISKNSKTCLTYIPKAAQTEALEWNRNWKELLRISDELTEINLKLLKMKAKARRQEDNPNHEKTLESDR